jgi:hypothetical protein
MSNNHNTPPGHNSDEITNRILLVSSFVSFPFHLRHAYKEYYHLSDEIINEILKAPDKRMQRSKKSLPLETEEREMNINLGKSTRCQKQ